MPPRVHKHCYLLVKDPINIPFNSTEDLKDPRLDYYTPRTSPSLEKDYSELSELDSVHNLKLKKSLQQRNHQLKQFYKPQKREPLPHNG